VSLRRIAQAWWPLAASWLLMSLEGPMVSAVIARLANPAINLAAYGGIVFPVALLVESPIIMLLAASTALSTDWASYQKVRRFMMRASAALTLLHILVAFTPLYYFVARGLIGAPEDIIEPGRLGLMIMVPWTWSIAYRRFHQGVLIRFGRSRAVGVGTAVRLLAGASVLGIGYVTRTTPGIIVGSAAVTAGVIAEAAFVGLSVQPVLRNRLRTAPPVDDLLTWRTFFAFYIPLALTSLLGMLMQPIGSAGLSRMPNALESLAVWPVVSGLVFMFRSVGMAYNEVVVALLDHPQSSRNLWRFSVVLMAATSGLLLVIAATPLSRFWFQTLSGLTPSLTNLARTAIWFALPLPALTALSSWYQGVMVHSRHTRGITEATVVFLLATSLLMAAGVVWGRATGLFVGLSALGMGTALQTAWLWYRSLPARRAVYSRDASGSMS
jgi:hypothetical protein